MIIQNGYIELKQKQEGAGIDPVTGYPVRPVEAAWGEKIPCQYMANSYSNLGRVNGEHFTTASYTVLIEEQPFDAEQLRITKLDGSTVGEFSIIQVEPLEAVCELRIFV